MRFASEVRWISLYGLGVILFCHSDSLKELLVSSSERKLKVESPYSQETFFSFVTTCNRQKRGDCNQSAWKKSKNILPNVFEHVEAADSHSPYKNSRARARRRNQRAQSPRLRENTEINKRSVFSQYQRNSLRQGHVLKMTLNITKRSEEVE